MRTRGKAGLTQDAPSVQILKEAQQISNDQSGSSDEAPSTSSDESTLLRRKSNKRERKEYKPEAEELAYLSESRESRSEEGDSDLLEEEEEVEQRNKPAKRRKSLAGDSAESSGVEIIEEEAYDEDEAAVQQALALSMKEMPGASGNNEREDKAGSCHARNAACDAEEDALQRALAASLADSGLLPGVSAQEANGVKSTSPAHLLDSKARLSTANNSNRDTAGQSREQGESASQAKGKGRKQQPRPPFPAPSLAMVQQAFQMLDPTGTGRVDPAALQSVAGKLLHKDLGRQQITAMMDFAVAMTNAHHSHRLAGSIDAEVFERLVAQLAAPARGK